MHTLPVSGKQWQSVAEQLALQQCLVSSECQAPVSHTHRIAGGGTAAWEVLCSADAGDTSGADGGRGATSHGSSSIRAGGVSDSADSPRPDAATCIGTASQERLEGGCWHMKGPSSKLAAY
jgi:hypothetical protein